MKPAPTIKPLTAIQLPPTVQGVLAARIDRLPAEVKVLLQTLAVIGKAFSCSLLTQVVEQSQEELQRLLAHLQGAEFIYERPAFPEPEYSFKHALTQEVAYTSLLLERRRRLHERTAQAIEALWGQRLEERYSELAHHYSRSGNTAKALEYLQRAARQAVQRSANVEALSHLTRGLEMLRTLPDGLERAQHELSLQIALGVPLIATSGYAAPEVETAYARARELCGQVGDTPQLYRVLVGLWVFYFVRGAFPTARELGEQLLRLAQGSAEPARLQVAHNALGTTCFYLGELRAARAHLEEGSAVHAPPRSRSVAFRRWQDPGVSCLCVAAWTLWALGYPDQALGRTQEALRLANALAHPFSQAFALFFAAVLHQLRREGPAVHAHATALSALAEEQGFALWAAAGTILQGWWRAAQGERVEGRAQLHQGLADWRGTGAEGLRPYFLSLLAETYGATEVGEEACALLAEALTVAAEHGERWWEAELYRLQGELLLRRREGERGRGGETAEECFQQALEVARRQQAKSLELRAALSLSRQWRGQGKNVGEVRNLPLLAEVYGWFTEGLETADLHEARGLLEASGST
ncbi:MAG: hypothetical protein HYZ81_17190 [Nitrospinae bacterium]|nr:hypothetical protein [Nitrospinota bacterium]